MRARSSAAADDPADSTLADDPNGKERPPAALQVPARYLLFALAALLLLFGVRSYRESSKPRPPDRVVRLLPTGDEDRARLRRLSAARSEVRLGLVTLTQGSRSLGTWLRHHRRHCGVSRVYMLLEPSADPPVLRRAPWTELVQVVTLGRQSLVVLRDYVQQVDRQAGPPRRPAPSIEPPSRLPAPRGAGRRH